MTVLVVVAVEAERTAVVDALSKAVPQPDADVQVVGVGPAESAARTSALLARTTYDWVLCAGIGGGFAPLVPGDVAVAAAAVFADLGAETPDGWSSASELGFGVERYEVAPALGVQLADRTGGHLGTIVTVATVTGTAVTTDRLRARFTDLVAEGMEGAGVAAAAAAAGVAFAELRAISNPVGPRDRDAWQLPLALQTLGRAVTAALATPDTRNSEPAPHANETDVNP